MRRFFSSLRFRLILLVLFAIIPAGAVVLHSGLEQHQLAASHAKEEALRLARLISNNHSQLIEGASHFLCVLAQLSPVRKCEPASCASLFADLLKQYPWFLNLGAAYLDGNIFASAVPMPRPINIADRSYFQSALETRRFAIGDYQIGRIVGKPVINFGYPVLDDASKVKAILFVAMDLTWLNNLSASANLPPGSSITVVNHNSMILARHPEPEKWVGKNVKELPIIKTILSQREGMIEAMGIDGVQRLYAFTPFGGTAQAGNMYVSMGIPTQVAFAQVDQILNRNLIALAFIGFLALLAVWVGGNLLILRRLNPLVNTAKRLAAGDLSARTKIGYGEGELNQLASTFDIMAESLELREAEGKLGEEARRKSEEEARRLARENAIMAEIGRIISSTLSIEDVYQLFAKEAQKLIPFDRISINLINLEEGTVVVAYVSGLEIPERRLDDSFLLKGSFTEKIKCDRLSLLNQPETIEELEGKFFKFIPHFQAGLRSMIAIPLVSRDVVSGVLHLQSTKVKAYTDQDLRLAERIASQIAGAIANAQLYNEHKRAEAALRESEEVEKRLAQENALVAEIGRIIGSTPNIDEVFERFSKAVAKFIPFDRIQVNLNNHQKDASLVRYVAGIDIPHRRAGEYVALASTASGECTRTKSTLLIQPKDAKEIEEVVGRFPGLLPNFNTGIRSIIMVPLIAEDQTIGVLTLRSTKTEAYTEQDVRLAESIASQIAGAVANAQLYIERTQAEEAARRSEEESKRLAEENEIVAEIGRIISSTLDIEEVYERFAQEVEKIIPFDRIAINIINPEDNNNTTTIAYSSGRDVLGRKMGEVIPLAGTATEEVWRTRLNLFIRAEAPQEIQEVIDRYPALSPSFQSGFRSMISVPLVSKDEVIGVLHIRSTKPNAYTEMDLIIAERVGNQIAGAIANAHLFKERIRTEKEMAALQEQLRQSQKMEAIGLLAGGIAHDFNNFLTVMKGRSQLALMELKEGDPLRESFEAIDNAATKSANLVRQLLAFSRRQVMKMIVLDLNNVLRDLEKMLRRIIGEDIELLIVLADDLGRVKADPGQIEQVLLNLAVNARDAMPQGGKLTIETTNVELDKAYARNHVAVTPGPYVMFSVSDTGVGMTPEVKKQVFEPFFTTKERGKGTGLGLATVYGIVKQSGGNIWVYSEPGQGATFKIYFPRVEELLTEEKEKEKLGLFRGVGVILVVEDEEMVRKVVLEVLQKQGYTILEAADEEDALLICQQYKDTIHLMVTDVILPKINGPELAKRLVVLHPEMKVLYMSGYTDNAIVHHGVLDKGVNYIQKPFTFDGLARKVREVLDKEIKPIT